ncbi:hypothetical protein [Saccharothrix stipae]
MNQPPALRLAANLAVLVAHLRAHPHLATVNANAYEGSVWQIAGGHGGLRADAQRLTEWADTIPDAHISALRYSSEVAEGVANDVKIGVYGTLDGRDIEVWGSFDASDALGLVHGQERDLTIDDLRALATREENDRG